MSTATDVVEEAPATDRRKRFRFPLFDIGGVIGAIFFFGFSLSPSLLPRGWLFQGVVAGVDAVIGYALGVCLGWLFRWLTPTPTAHTRAVEWRVVAVGGAGFVIISLVQGAVWQREIHELTGKGSLPGILGSIKLLLLAIVVFFLLLAIFRGLRWVVRWIGRKLTVFMPKWAAETLGAVLVVFLLVGFVQGFLYQGAISWANASFKLINRETSAGQAAPTLTTLSGSPGSAVSWDSLGRKGRDFIYGVTPAGKIEAFTGSPAKEPIRVYAGLDSSPIASGEAELVVQDLERTGAFTREVLCVITTTGTGWVDEKAIDALEYMYGGDTAMASMQYSYLPSFLSFIVDKRKAGEAGRELFNHVYDRWVQEPADRRPKLVVYGESLGSFGGESAFSGIDDIRARTSGALWVGPPNSNNLWRDVTAVRDKGTPAVLPVYQGGAAVRFAATPSELEQLGSAWTEPHVVYLQHASDPIIWWSPKLLVEEPEWLREPAGRDVLPAMRWYPLVTFLQVSADMAFANAAPQGHGHHYGTEQAEAWASIVPPPGWTVADTERLVETVGDER